MTWIGLTAAGPFDEGAMDRAALCLESAFAVETRRLDRLRDPDYAWDAARRQYSSTLVLKEAMRVRPPEAAKILVLTERDLFIPMLSFVYGQAQLDGPAAVLSSARLQQEFYALPPDRALFLLRLEKEVLHELGHTFGLTHCQDRLCTMCLSTNIEQLDRKRAELCNTCAILVAETIAAIRPARPNGRTE